MTTSHHNESTHPIDPVVHLPNIRARRCSHVRRGKDLDDDGLSRPSRGGIETVQLPSFRSDSRWSDYLTLMLTNRSIEVSYITGVRILRPEARLNGAGAIDAAFCHQRTCAADFEGAGDKGSETDHEVASR